ncbi:MAG: protein kinase domain-containing protein [Actinomycetota bacterium]
MSASALQTDITTTTTTLAGRYQLVRRVGAGGMGTVWEAEDAVLKRRVAVKILAPYLCGNENVAARFQREAQAAGRLTHPNVAQVFDYGEDGGCPYIVLELVPGSTLRQVLNDRGRLPAAEAAEVGAQIADALAAAHAEGIVHRDVKPGNVMAAPDGRVKVMDFGIADAVWFEPITDTGTIMATARYISPEQATGGGATAASDVYSLGVVLYEALAGRLPFEAESPFAIAHAHAYDPPPPLGRVVSDVPHSLVAAVETAMRKEPRERPRAVELAAALRTASHDDGASVLPGVATTTSVLRPDATARLPATVSPTGAPDGSRRIAVWMLAGMALLAVVLTLALTAFAPPRDAKRSPPAHRSPQASLAVAPSPPASSHDAPPAHDASGGKALGHHQHDDHGKGPKSDHGH